MSDRAKSLGMHSSLNRREVARGKVETYHVGYAQARPGVSWQNLAHQLGVNARDLERAVATAKAAAETPPPPAVQCASRLETVVLVDDGLIRGGSLQHRVLEAMARGVAPEPAHVEKALRRPAASLQSTFKILTDKGCLTQARKFAPYALTDIARAELARLGTCSHV